MTNSHLARSRRPAPTCLLPSSLLAALALAALFGLIGCASLGQDAGSGGATGVSALDPDAEQTALVLEGRPITIGELDEHMKDAFLAELMRQPESRIYEAREAAIRDLIQKTIVDAEASKRGHESGEALFEEVVSEAPAPTLEEVTSWYEENQDRLRGARFEEIAPQIEDLIANERRAKAWQAFLEPRLAALDYELMLQPPRQALEATRLVRGNPDAPVTLTSFSDYQCPYCIRSEPVLAEVLERYPEQVRLVHRHFPLDSIHPYARPAAEAAMCADEQGKFWEFHDAIFARSGKLDDGSFVEISEALELDGEAFGACVEERRYAEFVQLDLEAGRNAGVTGTPAFFVNGIALKGARDADELSRVVESELARSRSN